MPIERDEPFGIVMAEALACGTPVIAFPRGSVPEVIVDALNGFHAADVDEAAAAVGRVGGLDRAAIRVDAERRFGHEAIVGAANGRYFELAA